VNTNGLVELLEEGETEYASDRYGTHSDGEHIGNMDAIFAANDDLDLINGHLRLYNAGIRVVIEWYGATYLDADADPNYPDVANTMLFQVVLHQDGRITWNFRQLGFTLFDYDLFSGVYSNGGSEYSVVDGTLADVSAPAAFEFNPATREPSFSLEADDMVCREERFDSTGTVTIYKEDLVITGEGLVLDMKSNVFTRPSAPEYLKLLTGIEQDGLPHFEERFFTLLKEQSSENLAALGRHISEARKEIHARMEMVNESLADRHYARGLARFLSLFDELGIRPVPLPASRTSWLQY